MNALSINSKKHTIEMSKAYAKLASRFGSNEYQQLQEARREGQSPLYGCCPVSPPAMIRRQKNAGAFPSLCGSAPAAFAWMSDYPSNAATRASNASESASGTLM